MVTRLSVDVRRQMLQDAAREAARRGDRRIGTDHFLLAALSEPAGDAEQALGVDLADARAASLRLDHEALAAVGVDIGDLDLTLPSQPRRRPPFTSGARAVLERSVHVARAEKSRTVTTRHFVLALLGCQRPDPAAELLHALGVDVAAARARLG